MRQVVLLKDIPDLNEVSGLDLEADLRQQVSKTRINELDKRALEAALRTKEKNGGEVVVLSLGDDKTKTAILEALAMGADEAYIVESTQARRLDSNATSKVLAAALRKLDPVDLVLCGEMALDSMNSQLGPRLGVALGIPCICYVKEYDVEGGVLTATRDLDQYDEVVEVSLPAVVSVVREINEPRIPSLMNIMRARKKPQTVWSIEELGLEISNLEQQSRVEIQGLERPVTSRKQVKIEAETIEETVAKLVEKLREEGVI
ncbi:MAG TPA: electron transfer flavoprotein subunit beta/FixA family protein [Candidatus Bathyarchaeota archaeon]|nr:electron transfer flavoprotein subunit beta/FixA family protein [Candidatus Bathyarchaeota archaeon]